MTVRSAIRLNPAEIALNSISAAFMNTDMSGNVDYLNIAAEIMIGWLQEDADRRIPDLAA